MTNLNDSLPTDDVWNQLLSMVGRFDLDPDRVLDLIIESQLLHADKKIYANLIEKFKGESIALILANKLSKVPEKKSRSLVYGGYFENFTKTSLE